MSLALRNPRLIPIIALIALVVIALAIIVLLPAVGHINVLHMVGSVLSPDAVYGRG